MTGVEVSIHDDAFLIRGEKSLFHALRNAIMQTQKRIVSDLRMR